MTRWFLYCLFVAIAARSIPKTKVQKESSVIQTQNGPVQGFVHSLDLPKAVEIFWGLPYADPPVGDLRFKLPQAYSKSWTDVRKAVKLGSECPQLRVLPTTTFYLGDEDCLFLNVYKPESATSESKLPVYVFIHGGGYVMGSGYQDGIYDGEHLAANFDIIVVTMNYRMSAIGFFALEELCDEDASGSCGNYALQDQRMAMTWVQKNIANFGGDPTKVTIGGESAGAFSIMWHLVSAPSAPLYRGAIAESGTSEVSWFFQQKKDAFEFYGEIASQIGCNKTENGDRLACLRALPVADFILPFADLIESIVAHHYNRTLPFIPAYGPPLFPAMPFGPVVDGSPNGITDVPSALIAKGQFHKVPLLIGGNRNDGSIFEPIGGVMVPDFKFPATADSVKEAMSWFIDSPENVTVAENLYSEAEFASAGKYREDVRLAHVIRDLVFACSNRRVATSWAQNNIPAYLYSFAFDLGTWDKISHLGDFHASELPFVFRTYIPEISVIAPKAREMSDIISTFWANFVRNGDPNSESSTQWPMFVVNNTTQSRQYLSLRTECEAFSVEPNNVFPNDEFPNDQKCDFWDTQTLPWHPLKPTN